jgi:hypothetical protein
VHQKFGQNLVGNWSLPAMAKKTAGGDDAVWALFTSTPRVMFTRNPYVRFVSSYQDWLARNHAHRPNITNEVSFADFVGLVENGTLGVHFPDHVQPVSRACGHAVAKYDVILRLEEMALWFDEIIHKLDLQSYVDRMKRDGGFLLFESAVLAKDTVRDHLGAILGRRPWTGRYTEPGHARDSISKLAMHYTPELADRVFDLQREDFKAFGYPAWNGVPADMHFVK